MAIKVYSFCSNVVNIRKAITIYLQNTRAERFTPVPDSLIERVAYQHGHNSYVDGGTSTVVSGKEWIMFTFCLTTISCHAGLFCSILKPSFLPPYSLHTSLIFSPPCPIFSPPRPCPVFSPSIPVFSPPFPHILSSLRSYSLHLLP